MTVGRALPAVGRRACAALAATSAALHALMLSHSGGPAMVLLVSAMAVACLFCAYELWFGSALRTWCLIAVMNLAMIGVHVSAPGHHHEIGAVPQSIPPSTLMMVATGVSLIETVVAAAVLYYRTRARAALLALR